MDLKTLSLQEIKDLPRKSLQQLAKDNGIKANLKSKVLIEELTRLAEELATTNQQESSEPVTQSNGTGPSIDAEGPTDEEIAVALNFENVSSGGSEEDSEEADVDMPGSEAAAGDHDVQCHPSEPSPAKEAPVDAFVERHSVGNGSSVGSSTPSTKDNVPKRGKESNKRYRSRKLGSYAHVKPRVFQGALYQTQPPAKPSIAKKRSQSGAAEKALNKRQKVPGSNKKQPSAPATGPLSTPSKIPGKEATSVTKRFDSIHKAMFSVKKSIVDVHNAFRKSFRTTPKAPAPGVAAGTVSKEAPKEAGKEASKDATKAPVSDKKSSKPKFDLKASLARPLTYKPKFGPLKDAAAVVNKAVAATTKAAAAAFGRKAAAPTATKAEGDSENAAPPAPVAAAAAAPKPRVSVFTYDFYGKNPRCYEVKEHVTKTARQKAAERVKAKATPVGR